MIRRQAAFGLLVVDGVHLSEGASLAPVPETPRKVDIQHM